MRTLAPLGRYKGNGGVSDFPRLRRIAATMLIAMLSACVTAPAAHLPYAEMSRACDAAEASPTAPTSLFFVSTRLPDCSTDNPVLTLGRTDKVRYGWASSSPTGGEFLLSLASDTRWRQALRERLNASKSKRIILYIHGYNNTAEEALARAEAIAVAAGHDGPTIAMIWPSQAAILRYFWDETNADWTSAYTRGVLWDAVQMSDDVVIAAHSMGNRLALDAVRDVVRVRPALAPEIKHLVLAAPDVDRGTLQRDLHELDPYDIPATVYASLDDEPLHISWGLHGYPRAGDLNETRRRRPFSWKQKPFYFPIRNDRTALVDTSAVSTGVLGHADFVESKEGAADLCRSLNGIDPKPGRTKLGASGVSAWALIEDPGVGDDCESAGERAAALLD